MWPQVNLQALMRAPIQYGIVQTGVPVEGGVPCVRVVDLSTEPICTECIVRVDPRIHARYRKTCLEERDLLFVLRGDIGIVREVPPELVGANIHRGVARLSPNLDLVDHRYVLHALQSRAASKEMHERATGSALKELPINQLRRLPVPVPPLAIQRSIASVLDLLDERVALTRATLHAKLGRKRGLLQLLLSGSHRFPMHVKSRSKRHTPHGPVPADWRYVEIGDIAEESTHRAKAVDAPVLSCTKHDGFVESLQYFGRRVHSANTSNYKIIRRGEFGFPANHVEEGSIGYLTRHAAGLVSPIYIVFRTTSDVVGEFLYALFKTETYRHVFSTATNSSVNRRGSLRWEQFARIRVPLPCVEEQARIAALLDAVDQELSLLSQLVNALDRQKRALLDKIQSGDIRISGA